MLIAAFDRAATLLSDPGEACALVIAAGAVFTLLTLAVTALLIREVNRLRATTAPISVADNPVPDASRASAQADREQSSRLLFESNPLPMYVVDRETMGILAVNDAAVVHYGYSRAAFLNLSLLDLRPAEDRDHFARIFRGLARNAEGHVWRHQRADGTIFDVEVYSRMLDYDGRPARMAAVIDVSERRRAERERDRNWDFVNSVIESVPITVFVKNVRTRKYVLVNRAGEELWGLERSEIIGKTAHDLFPQATADMIAGNDERVLHSQALLSLPDHAIETPCNGRRVVTARLRAIRDEHQVPHLLGVLEDVTERRAVEDQLRQAQKMEAVGNLTGGLAHDFNNLLLVIIGNLDLLQEEVAGNTSAAEKVEAILQASLRGAELTRQLLAFSRRQPLQPKLVRLDVLLSNTMRLLTRTLAGAVRLDWEVAAGTPPVLVDETQLESALVNMAINARDAMPGGGTLAITAGRWELDAADAAADSGLAPGTYAAIAVSDTGTGMPSDVLARVFEPFFTTKGGKGTGLGLSMVYGFIKQSGGHITTYSEVGSGTTFRLYLPAAAPSLEAAFEAPAPQPARANGGEVILAVDDNGDVRTTVTTQLQDLGYRVITAESGEGALRTLDAAPRIDLLFTDMIMPGMDGRELAQRARKARPDLKVLFTSGFPGTLLDDAADFARGEAFLSKPYRKRDLAKKIRETLEA